MAQFARIEAQTRANRLILANPFRASKLNPFFVNRASGGLKIANRRSAAIRANARSRSEIAVFQRIDSRELPRFALRMAGPSKFGGHLDHL